MPRIPEPRIRGPVYAREIALRINELSGPVREIEHLLVDLYVCFFVDASPEAVVRLSRYYLARSYQEDAEAALADFRGYEPHERPFELVFHPIEVENQTGIISLRLR